MQADPEKRLSERTGSDGPPLVPIIAGIVLLVAAGVWLFAGKEEPPPAPEPPATAEATAPPVAPEPEPEPAPDIPPAPIPQPEPVGDLVEAPPPEPALSLDASDEPFREALTPVLDPVLLPGLEASDLLERGAAVVDGMSQGVLRTKLLPLPPPEGKFSTRKTAGQDYMDPAGFERYDGYASAIEAVDTEVLVANFHRFRPLLEEAYGFLGYEPENFDNAVIRSLDTIIAAPVIEEPLPVKKVEAVYKFEDAELEKLPDLQKQLLRMGPENTRRIQAQARALRAALLQP